MSGLKIVLTSWAPFIAGAEVAVERLAVGLAEAGNDLLMVVGTNGDAFRRFQNAGIRCEYVEQKFTDKWKWLQYRKSRNRLVEILRHERPDVVHSNDLPTHQMTSDAARRLGIPRICHHRWIFQPSAIDWLNKFGAEHHLFVSHALMDMLTDESPSLRSSSHTVVYDGLPIPPLPNEHQRRCCRAQLNLDHDRLLVLYAGQIVERKGVADLLHAWTLLQPWYDRAQLVIVGDDLEGKGAYRQQMEQLASELDCSARFVGFQNNVPDWLTAANVVVVPSHAEPLGNATLEAMAYSRPIVGSHVGGIPEMIVENKTGLLVSARSPKELASSIETLLRDEPLRQRLGQAARERCEQKFSIDEHIKNVLREYEHVLSARRAS